MNKIVEEYLISNGVFEDGKEPIDLSGIKEKGFVTAYEYLKILGFSLKKSKEIIRSRGLICSGEPVESLEEIVEIDKVKIKLA